MLITTPEELRLYSPAHAIDHIEPLAGIINSTEYESLRPILGLPLYDRLCQYYNSHGGGSITVPPSSLSDSGGAAYYDRLLLLAQPVIAFKTIDAAIAMNVLSINNAGINYSTAEDYPKADKEAIQISRSEYIAKYHAAVNHLLEELEHWYQLAAAAAVSTAAVSDASPSETIDTDLAEITALWRQSRYFYLAAQMLVPLSLIHI